MSQAETTVTIGGVPITMRIESLATSTPSAGVNDFAVHFELAAGEPHSFVSFSTRAPAGDGPERLDDESIVVHGHVPRRVQEAVLEWLQSRYSASHYAWRLSASLREGHDALPARPDDELVAVMAHIVPSTDVPKSRINTERGEREPYLRGELTRAAAARLLIKCGRRESMAWDRTLEGDSTAAQWRARWSLAKRRYSQLVRTLEREQNQQHEFGWSWSR